MSETKIDLNELQGIIVNLQKSVLEIQGLEINMDEITRLKSEFQRIKQEIGSCLSSVSLLTDHLNAKKTFATKQVIELTITHMKEIAGPYGSSMLVNCVDENDSKYSFFMKLPEMELYDTGDMVTAKFSSMQFQTQYGTTNLKGVLLQKRV